MTQEELLSIVGNFAIEGKAEEVCPLGNGLINTTYKVITADNGPVYVLQHVNTDIFPDPDMLMGNIVAVTDHIRAKLAADGSAMLTLTRPAMELSRLIRRGCVPGLIFMWL